MEYQYIQNDSGDIDYNRNGQLSDHQRAKLNQDIRKTESTIKLVFVVSIICAGLWVIASLLEYEILALLLMLILIIGLPPSLILFVSIRQPVQVKKIEGKIKAHEFTNLLRKALNSNVVIVEFPEHKQKFWVKGTKFRKFDEYSNYRMYYTQMPSYILSIHKINETEEGMIQQMDEERLTLWQ